jgi:hypothetical protein
MHSANSLVRLLVCSMILCGVSAQAQDKYFPADAVVNVTLPPYNAKPDDGQDDTAALQKAIRENVDTGRVLFFPAGTYNISDTLVAKSKDGLWRAHLTYQGQSRDRVLLRLADNAPGFHDPGKPKPVMMSGSHWQTGDSPDGGGNKAFRNNFFDLTVDTGSGNPGAIGIEWAVSNQGAIKNVTVRSGDGFGNAGIAMKRRIPGPGLIKNVSVDGFDVGIDVGDIQYGVTMENVTVHGQKIAGIRTDKNLLYIRRLMSTNRVPAVLITDIEGALTLLDSQLLGGATDQFAVDSTGNLLIRNVTTNGYPASAVRSRGVEATGSQYAQWVWPAALGAASTPVAQAGLLPIEETPEYWNANPADWIAVGSRKVGEADDTAAIQRALDSGKSTVYFRNDRVYFLSDTVVVRGGVRQILGMGAELNLGAAKEPFSDSAHPRPLIRIDRTSGPAVLIENVFFNAQYPGEVIFENNSPATLVIKHCGGWVGSDGQRRAYRNTSRATGKLFLEDVYLPGWEFTKQTVWARQLNPENWDGDGTAAQVSNSGGRLWILGFKTEGPSPFLSTTDGGVTELLGAYNYISATKMNKVPVDAVPYIVTDATASLSFVTENFRDNDYSVYIRNSQGASTQDLKGTDLWPRNGRKGDRSFAVPLYRSK